MSLPTALPCINILPYFVNLVVYDITGMGNFSSENSSSTTITRGHFFDANAVAETYL